MHKRTISFLTIDTTLPASDSLTTILNQIKRGRIWVGKKGFCRDFDCHPKIFWISMNI